MLLAQCNGGKEMAIGIDNKTKSRGQQNTFKMRRGEMKAKLKSSLSILGVFMGVSLLTYSLVDLHSNYIMAIIGLLLAPITMILKIYEKPIKYTMVTIDGEVDDDDEWEEEPRPPYLKIFFSYILSTIGVSLFIGSWMFIGEDIGKSLTLIYVGTILSVVSRYNLIKHKVIGIIEDYSMQVLTFAGVIIALFGVLKLTTSPLNGVALILVGIIVTPVTLILRENALLQRKRGIGLRKFCSMIAITMGLACSIYGVINLLNGGWLQSLVLIEGVFLVFGGAVLNENRNLVTIKDIL